MRSSTTFRPSLALAVAAAALGGCNLNEFTVGTTAPVIKEASRSFHAESDVAIAREAAPGQLKTADGFLEAAPQNRILLEVVAQGYAEYAYGFIEDDLERLPDDEQHARERDDLAHRATSLYDRAMAFALRLVDLDDRGFSTAFHKDVASAEAAAKKLTKKSVPGLFYAALSLGSGINLNRADLARVIELPKAVALLKRVNELDPAFYNGGAAAVLGTVYASQGKAIGGNPELAKKYFDESIAATGGRFLLTKVLKARFYAVVVQDRALFESILKEVLAAPADIFPEYRLSNELARRRATRYLEHADDYF
jgi:predicted anti-sigma-YlaC factor YlaD